MMFPLRFSCAVCALIISSLLAILNVQSEFTAEDYFPLLPGLEGAVEFWKQVFTRYGSGEVVLFDPIDPATTYRVVRVPDTEEGRVRLEQDRARIIADYNLNEEDGRIKSQRGAREQFILSGLMRWFYGNSMAAVDPSSWVGRLNVSGFIL